MLVPWYFWYYFSSDMRFVIYIYTCCCLTCSHDKQNSPAQYLADAAVADPELAGDVTRTYALMGQLHYPLPHHVRQGPPVYKHPTQLIHPSMPCGHRQQ